MNIATVKHVDADALVSVLPGDPIPARGTAERELVVYDDGSALGFLVRCETRIEPGTTDGGVKFDRVFYWPLDEALAELLADDLTTEHPANA